MNDRVNDRATGFSLHVPPFRQGFEAQEVGASQYGGSKPFGQVHVSVAVLQVPPFLHGAKGHLGEVSSTHPFAPIPFPV